MNADTLKKLKKVDQIIRKIRILQSESLYSNEFNHAVECLKLVKIQIVVDAENRETYEQEKLQDATSAPGLA